MDELLKLFIATAIFIYVSWSFVSNIRRETPLLKTVAILVLGDIGRSPRMMYHAESFATNDYQTFLIGYRGPSQNSSICDIL